MYHKFKNLDEVKQAILSIIDGEHFYQFVEENMDDLILLFTPKTKVLRYEEGNFCSNCSYQFKKDEDDFVYCVNCLESLACCDDELCDRNYQRTEEIVRSTLKDFYNKSSKKLNTPLSFGRYATPMC